MIDRTESSLNPNKIQIQPSGLPRISCQGKEHWHQRTAKAFESRAGQNFKKNPAWPQWDCRKMWLWPSRLVTRAAIHVCLSLYSTSRCVILFEQLSFSPSWLFPIWSHNPLLLTPWKRLRCLWGQRSRKNNHDCGWLLNGLFSKSVALSFY